MNEEETTNSLSGLPRHIREHSATSSASSSTASTNAGIAATAKKKKKKSKKERFALPVLQDTGISDPFNSIRAHKIVSVPKTNVFSYRAIGWSNDGKWCVGVGSDGFVKIIFGFGLTLRLTNHIFRIVTIFERWEDGVPGLDADSVSGASI